MVEFEEGSTSGKRRFQAPLARDLRDFCEKRLELLTPDYFDFV
jgi:hypothetical protein